MGILTGKRWAWITAAAAAITLGLFWPDVQHWLAVHLGILKAGPDPFYNFWSGFGSDFGEATILTGIVVAYLHHNCHVKGCPLLGHPVEGTPYRACARHHPAHKGTKRGVSAEEIVRHFEQRRQ
jgi:hypothetical protein